MKRNKESAKFGLYCCFAGDYNERIPVTNRVLSAPNWKKNITGGKMMDYIVQNSATFNKYIDELSKCCKKIKLTFYFSSIYFYNEINKKTGKPYVDPEFQSIPYLNVHLDLNPAGVNVLNLPHLK